MKFLKNKQLLTILSLFFVWRIGLFAVSMIAPNFLTYAPSFPYSDAILAHFDVPQWLFSWGNFDGVHYITIIDKGYAGADLIQAFFPGFPLIVKLVSLIINNILISALLVSNLFFLGFLYIWYLFVEKRYSKTTAFLSTLIILLFPTSFFFGAIYNESLFLTLVILTFWFAEKKNYLIAALFIAAASATRIVGILLVPAVLMELIFKDYQFNEYKKRLLSAPKKLKPIVTILLGSVGLLVYMAFLQFKYGDPLYFFHVQAEFGGIRQESLVMYPQVIYRYIKILLTVRPFNLSYFSSVSELIAGIGGLIFILLSYKKVKISYLVFALLAFILPTLTGTFSSMPRYVLVSFPIFILLALWAEKSLFFKYSWFIISGILLVFNTVLFIQGIWVA